MPVLIAFFLAVRRHYDAVGRQLRRRVVPSRTAAENHVVLLVPDLSPATAEALGYVRSFRPAEVRAVFIGDDLTGSDIAERWREFSRGESALERVPQEGGDLLDRLKGFIGNIPRDENDFVTVVIPEMIEKPGLSSYLIKRRDLIRLKAGLLRLPQVAVSDVPVVLEQGPSLGVDGRPLVPTRTVALVFISAVHDATARAVNYARSLRASETRAVFFAYDPAEAGPIAEQWGERGFGIPLDVVEAPFRDLGPPVLEEVRRITARPDSLAAVVMPELVVRKLRHLLLHNQTPLFVKRLLLFEQRVILTSVPFLLE
jgi:hypothetical protein